MDNRMGYSAKSLHPHFRNVKYFSMAINEKKAKMRGGYKKRGVK